MYPRGRGGGVSSFRPQTEPYLFPSCLIVRPKLKASDGSYVTIRTGTAENFLQAVEDVRDGKMGFCKAGKVYGVNHATLQKFYKAMGYHVRNKSNNPNFFKSPSDSDRDEKDCDSTDGSFPPQDLDTYHYSTYTPPRALYQHFMTQHMDSALLASSASSESPRVEILPRSVSSTNSTIATTSTSHPKNPPSTSLADSLSSKLESYTTGRLLNYASLYCEAIGVSDTDKDALSTPAPLPPAAPHSATHSQQQNSSELTEQQTLDINHPVLLCNL